MCVILWWGIYTFLQSEVTFYPEIQQASGKPDGIIVPTIFLSRSPQ